MGAVLAMAVLSVQDITIDDKMDKGVDSAKAGSGAKTGHLDPKTRELIGLAVATSPRCDGCIAVHTDAARQLGVTQKEMALMARGGRGRRYGGDQRQDRGFMNFCRNARRAVSLERA
jgi:AhpD family alkylhydroperoxidase